MITILFLAADPSNMLRLDEEARAIDQALRLAGLKEQFKFEQHWAVRVSDLQELLLRYKPEIVHFSGHGNSHSEIVLYDDKSEPFAVSINALRNLFSTLSKNLKCVILNSCYSEAQAEAIANEIDYVIGMSDEITNNAAKAFSTAFYRAIGFGENIKTAFDLGINQISLENLGEQEIPKLISLQTNKHEIVLTNKNTTTLVPQISTKNEINSNIDDLNKIITRYIEQNPLLTDMQVVEKLSNLVKEKINYRSSLPDDSSRFEVSSIVGDIFIRFTVEAQIHEKYSFDTKFVEIAEKNTLPEAKTGHIHKTYSDKRVFFTLLATDSGLSGYEKPTDDIDVIWSSETQKEPFQELPFLINPLLNIDIKRAFYGTIHSIATRGTDNNEPIKLLESMSLYEHEFPQGFKYKIDNHYLAGVFPSQYKVTVEAIPIYRVIYKRLASRSKGVWIFKDHYTALVKGTMYLLGKDELKIYHNKEIDL